MNISENKVGRRSVHATSLDRLLAIKSAGPSGTRKLRRDFGGGMYDDMNARRRTIIADTPDRRDLNVDSSLAIYPAAIFSSTDPETGCLQRTEADKI